MDEYTTQQSYLLMSAFHVKPPSPLRDPGSASCAGAYYGRSIGCERDQSAPTFCRWLSFYESISSLQNSVGRVSDHSHQL